MASQSINMQCWKCGTELKNILLPFSRYEECSHCKTDLHACITCKHYDPSISDACREDRAEYVLDKDKANFCDFFRVNPKAWRGNDNSEAAAARAKLAELFGDDPINDTGNASDAGPLNDADKALDELKRLFGDKD